MPENENLTSACCLGEQKIGIAAAGVIHCGGDRHPAEMVELFGDAAVLLEDKAAR